MIQSTNCVSISSGISSSKILYKLYTSITTRLSDASYSSCSLLDNFSMTSSLSLFRIRLLFLSCPIETADDFVLIIFHALVAKSCSSCVYPFSVNIQ